MIPRQLRNYIEGLRGKYPVITLTGPRQSGKTTLVRTTFSDLPYVSFENPDVTLRAEDDPRGFLAGYHQGAIFDEVQRVPEIVRYLQQIVDETGPRVCYVLTGSHQFTMLSGVTQSLAGRSALVHLLPFSLAERYPNGCPQTLDEVLFTGMYPPIHDRGLDPTGWFDSYVQLYVERDVRQLIHVRDLSLFRRFVRLCAGRTGQILNKAQLADDTGVSVNTVGAWLSVLEASFIIFLLPPHYANFNKRLVKAPKLYFYDAGLAAWLLGIRTTEELSVHSYRGHLFETMVVSERMKRAMNTGASPRLYYWRNRSGLEIDVIEEVGERLLPTEVKSGATLSKSFFAGLEQWTTLAGAHAGEAELVYGGDDTGVLRGIRYSSWRNLR